MAASKNTTELAAYLATVEVTPGNTAEMFRDMKDMISHLIDYVTESGTGTCVTNAVTINKRNGKITTEALTTAAAATQQITVTNDRALTTSVILVSLARYTGVGTPVIKARCTVNGTIVIDIQNKHAADAFDAEFYIDFMIA